MAKKEEKKVTNKVTAKKEKNIKKEKKSWFKGFKTELKKVTWPTPKELFNKTVAVLVSVLVVALIVFIFDFVFENVYKFSTNGIKSVISSEESETVGDTTGNIELEDIVNETAE